MVSKLVAFLTLAVLTLSIGGRAEAQPADYRTYFTFSAPVTLPGLTLPAGKYIFRLADPDGSRKVINVLSGDGRRSMGMLHSIPNQATKPPQDAEIRFMEADAQVPPPVKTWWYAGKAIGYEFIYPREQALQLAKSTKEPILTTAKDTTDFKNADLARITGSGVPTAVKVTEKPAPAEARGRAQQADVAQQGASSASVSPQGASSANAAAQDPRADERSQARRTELPSTASPVPGVLLFGALTMALGIGLSLWIRARA
jgi:hypothetical protein